MKLIHKKCLPCHKGTLPLSKKKALSYLQELSEWRLAGNAKRIEAGYRMKNFISAVKLIQKIAAIAEKEDHHPDIHLTGYRNLKIELSTHAIGGLSENDFILAAKISRLPKDLKLA